MDRITWYTFFYKVVGNKETYLTFLLKVDSFIRLKDFLVDFLLSMRHPNGTVL
jgi:hypothetical protein